MSDDLLKRLETGHDKECAMSYGMHEHCCDCSYPTRQEAAARVRELEAERERLRQAINRIHECVLGEWDGSESEIADVINAALGVKND